MSYRSYSPTSNSLHEREHHGCIKQFSKHIQHRSPQPSPSKCRLLVTFHPPPSSFSPTASPSSSSPHTDPSLLFLMGIHCQPLPAALPALSPSPARAEGISRTQISNICLNTRGPRYRDVQKHSLPFPNPHGLCPGFPQKKLMLNKVACPLN